MLVTAGTLLAVGCNNGSSSATVATPAPPAEQFGPPISDEECQQFAKSLESAVKSNRAVQVSKMFRFDDLLRRSISDLGLSPQVQQDIMNGARSTLQNAEPIAQIRASVKAGGSYHFLHLLHDGNRPKVLFRMINPEGAVNYHEFTITRFPDGNLGAEDIYSVATGEPISQTIRRFIIPGLQQRNGGVLSRLRGTDKQYAVNVELIQSMIQAVHDKRYADVQRTYRQLPKELQEDKVVLVAYAQGSAGVNDQDHEAAVETLRRLYPNDPCVDLMSVDYHLIRREYKLCLDDMNRLSLAIGGDPYLECLKVVALINLGELRAAAKCAEEAIEMEPDLEPAYWSRVKVSLRAKNHLDTLTWLKKITKNFNTTITDLSEVPEYAMFVKSPQYREWVKWYAARRSKAKS